MHAPREKRNRMVGGRVISILVTGFGSHAIIVYLEVLHKMKLQLLVCGVAQENIQMKAMLHAQIVQQDHIIMQT